MKEICYEPAPVVVKPDQEPAILDLVSNITSRRAAVPKVEAVAVISSQTQGTTVPLSQ